MTHNGVQVPGPLLESALEFVNASLQRMADAIQADGEAESTAIILTAKHGQSPLNNNQLQRIDDGPIIEGVNAAWAAEHPSTPTLVVQEADDDGLLWWLSDRSQEAADFVKTYLWTHTAPAVNYAGETVTVEHSGLRRIFAGEQSARFFGVANSEPAPPGRVWDRASRHDLHDRLEDRRARRGQPGRPGRAARRLRAGHRLGPVTQTPRSRRPRSHRRSCSCSDSTRIRCRPSSARARRSYPASPVTDRTRDRLAGRACHAPGEALPPSSPPLT